MDEQRQTKKSVLIVISLNKVLGACNGKDEAVKARALADSVIEKATKNPTKKAAPKPE